MPRRDPVPLLRTVGLLEGVSFLLLVGVAMPLKYAAGMPLAVKTVGWAHGVLFVLFCAVLVYAMAVTRWPVGRGAVLLVAALVPFGPFLIDRRLRGWHSEIIGSGDFR